MAQERLGKSLTSMLNKMEGTLWRMAEGASKRWINREADLEAAILYVNDTQDRER